MGAGWKFSVLLPADLCATRLFSAGGANSAALATCTCIAGSGAANAGRVNTLGAVSAATARMKHSGLGRYIMGAKVAEGHGSFQQKTERID